MWNAPTPRWARGDHVDTRSTAAARLSTPNQFGAARSYFANGPAHWSGVHSSDADALLCTASSNEVSTACSSESASHLAWRVAIGRVGGIQGERRADVSSIPGCDSSQRSYSRDTRGTTADGTISDGV